MSNKKVAAMVLAATMVIGSTFTAFAADATSGSASAGGEMEGHVVQETLNVVLPTVPEKSPFDYVTDPERLIQETAGARYEDYTFPDAATDTGVYFRVGDKEFANESEALQIINKSNVNVKVTVTVDSTTGGTDLTYATAATPLNASQIYLNVKVGNKNKAVTNGKSDVEAVVAGSPDNFEVSYNKENQQYEYTAKSDATTWQALSISMEGAVYKGAVADDKNTAPTVTVTWKFDKTTDSPSGDSEDYVDGPSVTLSSSGLITITGLTKEKDYASISINGTTSLTDVKWDTANYTAGTGGEIKIQLGSTWINWLGGKSVPVIVTLSDKTTISTTATISQ